MKLFPIVFAALTLTSTVALADDNTYLGSLEAGKSEVKVVSLLKGTNDVHIVDDHDNLLTCEFIDVAAGNVVVLRENNVQTCNSTSVNFSAAKLGVKVTNVNQRFISYEIRISTHK